MQSTRFTDHPNADVYPVVALATLRGFSFAPMRKARKVSIFD